jgi:hypothetical protein
MEPPHFCFRDISNLFLEKVHIFTPMQEGLRNL